MIFKYCKKFQTTKKSDAKIFERNFCMKIKASDFFTFDVYSKSYEDFSAFSALVFQAYFSMSASRKTSFFFLLNGSNQLLK